MTRALYLMRHGAVPQQSPRLFLGQRDVALSEAGLDQATRWREPLAGVTFAGAWCSALCRSRDTAQSILRGRHVPLVASANLNEISLGQWEGLSVAQVRARFPGQYEARGADMARFRPPGGESFTDVARRASRAIADIMASVPADQPGAVLVVAHGGVNRALVCTLLGIPLENLLHIGQDYACLNILRLGPGGPSLDALNLPPGCIPVTPDD